LAQSRQIENLAHVPPSAEPTQDPVVKESSDSTHETRRVRLSKRCPQVARGINPTLLGIKATEKLGIGNGIHNDIKDIFL
jgi:hypothetical protein